MWDGPRPDPKLACCVSKTATYQPMRKKGAIILGTGGDNSNSAMGNFYEGVIATGKVSNRKRLFGPKCKLKTIDLPRQAWDTPEETLKKRMRCLQGSVRLRPTMQSRRTSLPWVTKPSSLNNAIVMSSDVGFNVLISGDHRYGFVSLIRIQSNA
jgi:hypothetical protein